MTALSNCAPAPESLATGTLTLADGRTRRFCKPDSSISGRTTCKSSVTEITGKSRVITQASSTNEFVRHTLPRPCSGFGARCKTQNAGRANASHTRLRSSSTRRVRPVLEESGQLCNVQRVLEQNQQETLLLAAEGNGRIRANINSAFDSTRRFEVRNGIDSAMACNSLLHNDLH